MKVVTAIWIFEVGNVLGSDYITFPMSEGDLVRKNLNTPDNFEASIPYGNTARSDYLLFSIW